MFSVKIDSVIWSKTKLFLTTFPQAGFYIQIGHGHKKSYK